MRSLQTANHSRNWRPTKGAVVMRRRHSMPDRRQTPRDTDVGLLGRRAASRARIALPASLETVGGRVAVSLLNLSRTGAMVAALTLPAVGQDVIVKCGTVDVLGIVIWVGSGRCGVQFDEPLDATDVICLRQEGDSFARTGITCEERQAAKDWVEGR